MTLVGRKLSSLVDTSHSNCGLLHSTKPCIILATHPYDVSGTRTLNGQSYVLLASMRSCFTNSLGFQPLPHRALAIPEVLSKIFRFAYRSGWRANEIEDRKHRQNILWLALCCRDFAGPALDMLWEYMPGIHPIIKLLPLIDVQGHQVALFLCSSTSIIASSDCHQVLERVIQDHEWEQLLAYGGRVRHIRVSQDNNIHPSVYTHIAMKLGPRPLLHGVRGIECDLPKIMSREASSPLPLLVSQTLHRVDLSLASGDNHSGPSVFAFLTALREGAPYLRTIRIDHDTVDQSLHRAIAGYLLQATSLVSLEWNASRSPLMDCPTFFHSLLRLPNLKRFELNYEDWDCTISSTLPGLGGDVTCSLGGQLPELPRLLEQLPEVNVSSLSLWTPSCPPDYLHQWDTCARLVCSRFSKTLRAVELCLAGGGELGFDIVQCWFRFHDLEKFKIDAQEATRFVAADTDIRALASAWPQLRSLCMELNYFQAEDGCVFSPMCLPALAQHCRFLRSIKLPIQGEVPVPATTPLLSHDLTTIEINHGGSINAMSFAEHVHRLFPRVRVSGTNETHAEVSKLLALLQRAVRDDSRRQQ